MPTPFDYWASDYVVRGPALWPMVVAGVLGWMISRWCWHWVDCLIWDIPTLRGIICPHCGAIQRFSLGGLLRLLVGGRKCSACGKRTSGRWMLSLFVVVLFAGFTWAVGKGDCQSLTYGGSVDWIHWRIAYHLLLIGWLIAATKIDLQHYIIPDSITLSGMLIGIVGATWFGNLQLIPVWVDANQEVPGLLGPYVPDWIKHHWYWHGFVYSVAGLVVGGGLTWLVRWISSMALGQEALGFGDVTLMAMIGSFIGWQATIFVFALAPVCGLIIAIIAGLITGKPYVPYGPYLSASCVVVLFTWQWLWNPLRKVFGHAPTIIALVGGSLVAVAILLLCLRGYRSIPGKR